MREAFSFRPGQWVDFYAPGVEKPGVLHRVFTGSFARDGTFVLAVRASAKLLRAGTGSTSGAERETKRASQLGSSRVHARTAPTCCCCWWPGAGIAPPSRNAPDAGGGTAAGVSGTRVLTPSPRSSRRRRSCCARRKTRLTQLMAGRPRGVAAGGGAWRAGGIPSHGRRTNRGHPSKKHRNEPPPRVHRERTRGCQALRGVCASVRGGGARGKRQTSARVSVPGRRRCRRSRGRASRAKRARGRRQAREVVVDISH